MPRVKGPTIQLRRRRVLGGSCREALLDYLDRGRLESDFSAAEIQSELAREGTDFADRTVYKALLRMAGEGLIARIGGGRFCFHPVT